MPMQMDALISEVCEMNVKNTTLLAAVEEVKVENTILLTKVNHLRSRLEKLEK